MNTICTICVRGGSKGLKNKSLKKIHGKPLLAYTIRQAIKSKLFKEVVVSTDTKKIQNIAKKYGASCWFLRPKKLSNDKSPKLDAIKHVFKESEKYFNKKFDCSVDLDITSPLRTITDIKKSLIKFSRNNHSNNLISVCYSKKNPYFNMIEKKKDAYKLIKSKTGFFCRQDTPEVFDINASIYIFKRNFLLSNIKLINNKTSIYLMPRSRSIDIDDIHDFDTVKYFLKKNEKLFR